MIILNLIYETTVYSLLKVCFLSGRWSSFAQTSRFFLTADMSSSKQWLGGGDAVMSWSLLSSPHLSSGDLVPSTHLKWDTLIRPRAGLGLGLGLGWRWRTVCKQWGSAQCHAWSTDLGVMHFSFVFCHQHRLAFCLPCSGLAVPSDICHIYPISTLHQASLCMILYKC